MELNFSFKAVKEETLEKYPELPVLTFLGGENVTKFSLNKKAVEILSYGDENKRVLNYARNMDNDELLLVNTNAEVKDNSFVLNKDNTINNKALFTRMEKAFGISIEENAEFLLSVPKEESSYKILVINNATPESVTTDSFEEFPDNAFEENKEEIIIHESREAADAFDADPSTSSLY